MLNNLMNSVTEALTRFIVWLLTGMSEGKFGSMDAYEYYSTYGTVSDFLNLPVSQMVIMTILVIVATATIYTIIKTINLIFRVIERKILK